MLGNIAANSQYCWFLHIVTTLPLVMQVAKAIGYMVNANSTVGGGCPVPPPPTRDLTRFGTAMATAINGANNKTGLWVGQSLASVAAAQSSPNITVASLQVRYVVAASV